MNETTRGPKVCHVTKTSLALIFRLNACLFCLFLFPDFFLSVFTEYSTFSPLAEMTSSFVNELFLTCISSLEYGASDEHGYGHQSPLQDRASDEHGYGHQSPLQDRASDEHGYGHQSPLQDRASDEHGYGASDEHGYVHQLRLQYGEIDEHGYGRHSYSTEQAMNMVMDVTVTVRSKR